MAAQLQLAGQVSPLVEMGTADPLKRWAPQTSAWVVLVGCLVGVQSVRALGSGSQEEASAGMFLLGLNVFLESAYLKRAVSV